MQICHCMHAVSESLTWLKWPGYIYISSGRRAWSVGGEGVGGGEGDAHCTMHAWLIIKELLLLYSLRYFQFFSNSVVLHAFLDALHMLYVKKVTMMYNLVILLFSCHSILEWLFSRHSCHPMTDLDNTLTWKAQLRLLLMWNCSCTETLADEGLVYSQLKNGFVEKHLQLLHWHIFKRRNFWLTLKPSSIKRMLDVVTHDLT